MTAGNRPAITTKELDMTNDQLELGQHIQSRIRRIEVDICTLEKDSFRGNMPESINETDLRAFKLKCIKSLEEKVVLLKQELADI